MAAQDVRDKVSIATRNLPRDIRPPIISKADNDQAPVVTIALSGDRSMRELTEIADKTVKVALERSTGVGEVRLVGGLLRSVNIWVDADRMAAHKTPGPDLSAARWLLERASDKALAWRDLLLLMEEEV